MDSAFWKGKKVFLTGHTGFKGSWLSLWLLSLGAEVTGFSLRPPAIPNLFTVLGLERMMVSIYEDVRSFEKLKALLAISRPDIVIHMAAQPLVRESYELPVKTYEVNVMGTVYLLESARRAAEAGVPIRAVLNVTTDNCYSNTDPYSNSKACSELVTASYRNSFFPPAQYGKHGVAVATARAGNVIGGGDWAKDRLIPDFFRSVEQDEPLVIRNPDSIRPWQHVLEPLSGYLTLAQQLVEAGPAFGDSWNFSPAEQDAKSVEWIVGQLCGKWGEGASYKADRSEHLHEAGFLKLDSSRARMRLGWEPAWHVEEALDRVVEWMKAYSNEEEMTEVCLRQIHAHQAKRP